MKNKKFKKADQHQPSPLREYLLFLAVSMSLMFGPLLIPGVTIMHWITGFFAITIIVYFVACIIGIWQGIARLTGSHKRKDKRNRLL